MPLEKRGERGEGEGGGGGQEEEGGAGGGEDTPPAGGTRGTEIRNNLLPTFFCERKYIP